MDITEIRYKLTRQLFKIVKQNVVYKHSVSVFIVCAFYMTFAEMK